MKIKAQTITVFSAKRNRHYEKKVYHITGHGWLSMEEMAQVSGISKGIMVARIRRGWSESTILMPIEEAKKIRAKQAKAKKKRQRIDYPVGWGGIPSEHRLGKHQQLIAPQ